jgi:hypothetical protein
MDLKLKQIKMQANHDCHANDKIHANNEVI